MSVRDGVLSPADRSGAAAPCEVNAPAPCSRAAHAYARPERAANACEAERARLPGLATLAPRFVAFAALATTVFLSAPARATDCSPASRVSTCVDVDSFWPRAGGAQFLGLGGTELTAPGQAGFGLVTSFQKQPLTLRLPSPDPGGSESKIIDNQLDATFLFSIGLSRRFELTAAAPVTLTQDGTGPDALTSSRPTPLVRTVVRDARLGITASLLPRPTTFPVEGLALVARFELAVPTGDPANFAGAPGPVEAPSLTAEYHLDRFFAAAEADARFRKSVPLGGGRFGSQLGGALGVGAYVLPRELLSVQAEASSLVDLDRQYSLTASPVGQGAVASSASALAVSEWQLSVRSAPALGGDLSFSAGGGTGLRLSHNNPTEPLYRFVLGVRYAPLARDSDGDGVLDRDDRCPSEREDRDGFQDNDVCPDPDNDGDGILDTVDACPQSPGIASTDPQKNGCPDGDADNDGIPDSADACPRERGPRTSDPKTNGCPPDRDHDGVADAVDACPDAPGPANDDPKTTGCPPDKDRDGVPDAADACPDTAGVASPDPKKNGCPASLSDPTGVAGMSVDAGLAVQFDPPLRFAQGQSAANDATTSAVAALAQFAQKQALVDRYVIETYGDSPGQAGLARKRADTLKAALAAAGLGADRVTVAPGDPAERRARGAPHADVHLVAKRLSLEPLPSVTERRHPVLMPAAPRLLNIALGADLLAALEQAAGASAWVQGNGHVEAVEIRLAGDGADPTRALRGRLTLVTLGGPSGGPFTVTLARATDSGVELLGGTLVRARSAGVQLVVFDAQRADAAAVSPGEPTRRELAAAEALGRPASATPAATPAPAAGRAPAAARPSAPAVAGWSQAVAAADIVEDTADETPDAKSEVDDEEEPIAGDVIDHFSFGACEVLTAEGDRLRIRDLKGGGRIREISLDALNVTRAGHRDGKRQFRLARKM